MSIKKPRYAQAFRDQMVELVRSGRKPSELAKEFGCHSSGIAGWLRPVGGANVAAASALSAQERKELVELRRKLRQVQVERDIWAKAGPVDNLTTVTINPLADLIDH